MQDSRWTFRCDFFHLLGVYGWVDRNCQLLKSWKSDRRRLAVLDVSLIVLARISQWLEFHAEEPFFDFKGEILLGATAAKL